MAINALRHAGLARLVEAACTCSRAASWPSGMMQAMKADGESPMSPQLWTGAGVPRTRAPAGS